MIILLIESVERIAWFSFVDIISVHMNKFWGYIGIYVAQNLIRIFKTVQLAKLNICIDIPFGIYKLVNVTNAIVFYFLFMSYT